MARPRRRTRPSVSLFPFLSVLACVIGVLTLLIAATAIGQIATDAIDLELYENLEREIASGRRRLAELTGLQQEIARLDEELIGARSDHDALARDRETARNALEQSAPLRRRLLEVDERVASLERELESIDDSLEKSREEIARLHAARTQAPIVVRPSGSGHGLEPHFAECREDGLVIYEGRERRATEIPTHRIATSAEYRRFLRRVRFRDGATVIFLIRSGGVPAFESAARQAATSGVRHGEIPLPGDGELDFSELPPGTAQGVAPR